MSVTIRLPFLPLLCISFLLSACAIDETIDVDQDSIFTEYQLVYDASKNSTMASAIFRFEGQQGTVLELSDPAEVTVKQEPMTWKAAKGQYEREWDGKDSLSIFAYHDLNNNTFSNTVLMAADIAVPQSLLNISKAEELMLEWEGKELATNESVVVTIFGAGQNNGKVFTQTSPATTSITLDQGKLKDLAEGEGSILIERWAVQVQEEGSRVGGATSSRYLAKPVRVMIGQ